MAKYSSECFYKRLLRNDTLFSEFCFSPLLLSLSPFPVYQAALADNSIVQWIAYNFHRDVVERWKQHQIHSEKIRFKWEFAHLIRCLHDPTGWTNVYTVKLLIQPVGTIVEWTFTWHNCWCNCWTNYRPDSWTNTRRCDNQSSRVLINRRIR